MNDDSELLQDYLNGSEAAFRELVGRYVNLVYSAALRHLTDRVHAEDVVQTVFTALAQKARRLPPDVVLGGWLYRHTCFVAAQVGRSERRRQAREREAIAMNVPEEDSEPEWDLLSPILDEGMRRLGTLDRNAVVLRFFERRDLQSVGAVLGIGEEAARKRVTRALEKLRTFFARRGATLSTATLGSLLAGHAVVAAPAGLGTSAAAAALAATAANASTLSLIHLLTMTKLKLGIIGALIGAAVVTPVVLHYQAKAKLRASDAALQDLALQQASAEANRERLAAQVGTSGSEAKELVRLRAQAADLRQGAKALPAVQKDNRRLQAAVDKPTVEPTPEQEAEVMAKMNYGKMAVFACMRHAQTNRGLFPSSFEQVSKSLPDELKAQTDPNGEAFEVVYSGTFKALTVMTNASEVIVIRQREPSQYGNRWAKVYVCGDGHCEIHTQSAPDFSDWEKQHTVALSTATR